MRLPLKKISPPESGRWKPITVLTSVDLPAPLSPSSPTISPGWTLKSMVESERTSPKVFDTLRSSITGTDVVPSWFAWDIAWDMEPLQGRE